MGFDQAGHHVLAIRQQTLGFRQHFPGLTDARGGPQKQF